MHKKSKLFASFLTILVVSALWAPMAFADVNCDGDSDGYVALTQDMLETVVQDNAFKADGNYPPEQWNTIYQVYKSNVMADSSTLDARYVCESMNFKKGVEPTRCDAIQVDAGSGVYDTSKVQVVSGVSVNPGAFDVPDNGIDENCDGSDGVFLAQTGSQKDLGSLVQKVITRLGQAVAAISVIILIWGGILYATAAGDEQKTAKARKAMIGALIGLIVGLLAPSIVNLVVSSLG